MTSLKQLAESDSNVDFFFDECGEAARYIPATGAEDDITIIVDDDRSMLSEYSDNSGVSETLVCNLKVSEVAAINYDDRIKYLNRTFYIQQHERNGGMWNIVAVRNVDIKKRVNRKVIVR